MATVNEDASDGLLLAGERGPSDWTSRACEHFSLGEAVTLSKDQEVTELGFTLGAASSVIFSSDAISGFTLAGAGVGTMVVSEVVTSSLNLGDARATSPVVTDAEETMELEATATAIAEHSVTAGFTLAETATGTRVANASAVEGLRFASTQGTGKLETATEAYELDAGATSKITHVVTSGLTMADAATQSRVASGTHAEAMSLGATAAAALTASDVILERFSMRGIGAPVDPDAPVLWANSKRMASAVWKGLPFDSFVVHRGQLLGFGVAGISRFTGSTDDGDPVAARVVTDLTDLGSNKKKVFDSVLMSGTASGPLAVTVETEMGSFRYSTHLPSAAYPATHRAPLGRGITGRYARFTLDNAVPDHVGASFAMEDINVIAGDSQRVR